jgi:hypothetical protein
VLTLTAPQLPLPPSSRGRSVIGWRFYHVKIGVFLYVPLECDKCDTSHHPITPRATPTIIETRPRKLGSVKSQWYIIIIIIIYFLPIVKDVTNTETTVKYGLKVTQTVSIVPIHNLTIYNVGFLGGLCIGFVAREWAAE